MGSCKFSQMGIYLKGWGMSINAIGRIIPVVIINELKYYHLIMSIKKISIIHDAKRVIEKGF